MTDIEDFVRSLARTPEQMAAMDAARRDLRRRIIRGQAAMTVSGLTADGRGFRRGPGAEVSLSVPPDVVEIARSEPLHGGQGCPSAADGLPCEECLLAAWASRDARRERERRTHGEAGPSGAMVLDPWCVVEIGGRRHLFGFAEEHPVTGGLSWLRTSRVERIDEAAGTAVTESGSVYRLGRRIEAREIDDEEALVAKELLVDRWPDSEAEGGRAGRWLTARKVARHLGVEPPSRSEAAVDAFLGEHKGAYLRKMRGAGR